MPPQPATKIKSKVRERRAGQGDKGDCVKAGESKKSTRSSNQKRKGRQKDDRRQGKGKPTGRKGGKGERGKQEREQKQRGRGKRQKVNQCRSRATCVAPSRQRRHQESRSAAKQVVSTFLSQDHAACQYTGSQSGSEATHARRTLSCFPTCSLELSSKTGG